MRTVEYQTILNHAAELAGRSRNKLPTEERAMLRGYLAAYLTTLWTAEAWPELMVLEECAVANRQIDRREGRRMVSGYSGTYAIPSGVDSGTVPLDLSRTPASVTLTVSAPSNTQNLFATLVDGTLSKTGFDFTLSGITDQTGYILNFEVVFQ